MKMQLKSLAAVLAAVIIGTLIFPATLHGQAQLSGSYVFTEEGLATANQRIAALARITFATDGTLVGRQMALAGNSVVVSDVQGTYSFEADGMGTMVLSVSGKDAEGEDATFIQNYKMVRAGSGELGAVRANVGVLTVAKICPTSPVHLQGQFLLTERLTNLPMARLAVLNLDSAGPVTGFEMVSTVSGITRTSVTGLQTKQADGFRSLVLSAEIPGEGEDAAPITLRENYAILSTTAELKALRLDSGAVSIVTFTR